MRRLVSITIICIFSFSIFPCDKFTDSAYSQEYKMGPDDVLNIVVYREEELNRKVRISPDGFISLPLVGKVKAEGLAATELENVLLEKFKKYLKNPQITVFIEGYGTFTVTGQVRNPGSFQLKSGITVIEAIGLAGGFTEIAAKNSVKVMRYNEKGEEESMIVRVADISKKGGKKQNVYLKRGDIVFVPESTF